MDAYARSAKSTSILLMVLAFSGTILLVHMRTGDMMGDVLFLKEIIKFHITPLNQTRW
jgi:hypothetical protein